MNRVKHLLPNMFCTGDDDGVIKVCLLLRERHPPIRMYHPSFGTREDHRKYAGIPTILILSPTFYGSATKSNLYLQGNYLLTALSPFLSCSPDTKRRWYAVGDGCTWKEIGAAGTIRRPGGRTVVHRCYKKVSTSFLRCVGLWTSSLGLAVGQRSSSVLN